MGAAAPYGLVPDHVPPFEMQVDSVEAASGES
jgi:hypothetical protein